jgi:hypothetical protein
MGGGLIKKLSSSLLPSHLRSPTALRLCASTFRTLHKHCNGGRNDQPPRLSSIFPICFGVMGVTLPGRRSYNGVTDWNRSSAQREWG